MEMGILKVFMMTMGLFICMTYSMTVLGTILPVIADRIRQRLPFIWDENDWEELE